MTKIIESPVKRFPGRVHLADPLNFEQYFAIEEAIETSREFVTPYEEDGKEIAVVKFGKDQLHYNHAFVPAIIACVEKWEIQGLPEIPTVKDFPASPVLSAARFASWLIDELMKVLQEAEEIPNA